MFNRKLVLAIFFAATYSVAGNLDSLFQRLKWEYSTDAPVESAKKLLDSQRSDGTWPNINYKKKKDTPINHLKNARLLAEEFEYQCSKSAQNENCKKLKNAVIVSLQYWFRNNKDFVSDNWWTNEIGIQRELGPIGFLMWNDIPDELKSQMMAEFPEAPSRDAVNRTWISELVVMRGILEQRDSLVRLGLENIEATMMISGREGHQKDHSYFMHGNLLYNGGYGKQALTIAAKWAYLCRGTDFAFDSTTVSTMSSLALEGNRWMTWKGLVDPMTMGREISRKGENKDASSYLGTINCLNSVDSAHSREYESWRRDIRGADTLRGCKYFWRGEMMVCRSKNHYISLKMSSSWTVASELVNNENKKGLWVGSGVVSTYRHADDYANIYPLWDWAMLPGVTSYGVSEQKEKYLTNSSKFVGGFESGNVAVASMELNRPSLHAKKSWYFVEGKVVALGTDINSSYEGEITTTMDQRLLKSKPFTNSRQKVLFDSLYSSNAVWIDSLGYKTLDDKPFYFKMEKRENNWKSIGTRNEKEKDSLITFWYSHGLKPKDGSYAYSIDVNVGKAAFLKKSRKRDVEVLENNSKVQMVRLMPRSNVAGTLYEPQTIDVKPYRITFSEPCIFLMKQLGSELHFVVADPTKSLEKMKITVEKIVRGKASLEYTSIVNFPQHLDAGKSVDAWFEM